MNKALTVYKASAGSGKTFTLAVEFIKLLIIDPRRYERILAVTFTNKATEEMKHRIVSQLYGLAHKLPSSNDYMEKITAALDMPENMVSEKAAQALHNLLHNYNMFRVQTIDAFFQTVLRNMAKEIGLGNNMRVVLKDSQIINEAVDNLFDSLNNDKELLKWIMEYVNEVMDADGSWDIKKEVKSFGQNLSKEFYMSHEHLLDKIENDEKFFRRYKKTLREKQREIKAKAEELANKFFNALESNGVQPEQLKQKKSGVYGYFLHLKSGNLDKEPNTHVQKAIDSCDEWGTGENKEPLANLARTTLRTILLDAEDFRKKNCTLYNSITLTLKNINKMSLLTSIKREVNELNKENSRFMLSNTQTLLSNMIQGGNSEAPFIFEKIGAYLQHIMIDEFQDTSIVQWKNFKVLLEECLSIAESNVDGKEQIINNLIVGDVKQSIYRFRSGDWRLLNDIDADFYDGQINVEPLKTNWRSERNIIEFNNAFFRKAAQLEADTIMPKSDTGKELTIKEEKLTADIALKRSRYAESLRMAYSDVAQLVPEKKPARGLVRVEMMPKSSEFKDKVLERTLEYTMSLIEQGVHLSDIAILVRWNNEAKMIANYFALNAPQVKIISEEAFALEASPAVLAIMSALKYIANKKDMEARITLLKIYTAYTLKKDIADNELLTNDDAFKMLLPEEITDENKHAGLISTSLYELVEHLYQILDISKIEGQEPYVCQFFDKLRRYIDDNGAILEEFINYWDSDLHSEAILFGGLDSITVITIHKSKGLEYKHVIMPFCCWSLGPNNNKPTTLWCDTDTEYISELPFIPVSYTGKKALNNSIYDTFGTEEWMQDIVDNLNLLYVAFTRAERSLFVITDQSVTDSARASVIIRTLQQLSSELEGTRVEGIDEIFEKKSKKKGDKTVEKEAEAKTAVFTFGQHYLEYGNKKETEKGNVFEKTAKNIPVTVRSFNNASVEFRQSNNSREFASDEVEENDRQRFTTMGSIMHMLFSKIKTVKDIGRVLKQFEFDGVIYDDDVTPEMLRTKLKEKFSNPTVADWFSERWTVFNECNIMRIENGLIKEERPDRVITENGKAIVIDYKFGKRNDGYNKQVERYMKLLKGMGYEQIEGYIWYVNEPDGIVKVQSTNQPNN